MSDGLPSASRPPAFFLEDSSAPVPRLRPEEEQHATRVLRLAPPDALVGLDGRGTRVPLRVIAARKKELVLERSGPSEFQPEPGSEGAPLPWIELAISWPRRNRLEDMVNRLVQLGAAAIRPLAARQRGPEEIPAEPSERLLRVAREACKQAGRVWLPEFAPLRSPQELAREQLGRGRGNGCALAMLDPHASLPFDSWLRSLQPSPLGLGTRARSIVLVVGPEGGLDGEEREALLEAGASPVWLGPHVLRVETAAEAGMAVAAAVHARRAPA